MLLLSVSSNLHGSVCRHAATVTEMLLHTAVMYVTDPVQPCSLPNAQCAVLPDRPLQHASLWLLAGAGLAPTVQKATNAFQAIANRPVPILLPLSPSGGMSMSSLPAVALSWTLLPAGLRTGPVGIEGGLWSGAGTRAGLWQPTNSSVAKSAYYNHMGQCNGSGEMHCHTTQYASYTYPPCSDPSPLMHPASPLCLRVHAITLLCHRIQGYLVLSFLFLHCPVVSL